MRRATGNILRPSHLQRSTCMGAVRAHEGLGSWTLNTSVSQIQTLKGKENRRGFFFLIHWLSQEEKQTRFRTSGKWRIFPFLIKSPESSFLSFRLCIPYSTNWFKSFLCLFCQITTRPQHLDREICQSRLFYRPGTPFTKILLNDVIVNIIQLGQRTTNVNLLCGSENWFWCDYGCS